MIARVLAVAAALTLLAGVGFAAPHTKSKSKKPAAKTVNVMVCPITLSPVTDKSGGKEVVGKYTVHFCCPSCKPDFDKLSKTQKLQKIAVALKKQNALKHSSKKKVSRVFAPSAPQPAA